MPQADPIDWYERHATQVVGSYEAQPPERLHGLLPAVPALVLDIGAGTGRDAAWFAGLGHDVVAVEPASAMRAEAARLHPGPRIRWLNDRLPDLAATLRLGLAFAASIEYMAGASIACPAAGCPATWPPTGHPGSRHP
jgi:SAM-dependent methyltransferase